MSNNQTAMRGMAAHTRNSANLLSVIGRTFAWPFKVLRQMRKRAARPPDVTTLPARLQRDIGFEPPRAQKDAAWAVYLWHSMK